MEQQELAERLLVIRNLQDSVDVVQKTNKKEESLLKLWKFVFEIVFVLMLFMALKVITFVSFWKAHYRDFIAFMDKISSTLGDNGMPIYTGPKGTITALALESNILLLTFSNPYFPEAMFMLFATPELAAMLDKPGGQNIPQNMYLMSLEGTANDGRLNATEIVCRGITKQFPDFDNSMCGSVCSVKAANASMPFGQRVLNSSMQSAANGGMVGHVVASGIYVSKDYSAAAEVGWGASIGVVAGLGLGVLGAYLEQQQANDICDAGRKFCNNKSC